MNPDLSNLSDIQASIHYIVAGIRENRLYELDLPNNFDPLIYISLNPDLSNLNLIESSKHYSQYGINENRKYDDPYFDKAYFAKTYNHDIFDKYLYKYYSDDIKQEKNEYFKNIINDKFANKNKNTKDTNKYTNAVLLVNHDTSIYGASHYLYVLYGVLKNNFPNIKFIICEVKYNITVTIKYNIPKSDIIEYYGDPTMLYMIYDKIKPLTLYLNSCNFAIYKLYEVIERSKIILHSHEIFKDYLLNITTPDFVVSDRIAKQYLDKYNIQPKIQQPILNSNDIIRLANDPIDLTIHKFNTKFDITKINICMCGQVTDRKNYKLFIQIAKAFPQYNFIWIGGTESDSIYFNDVPNIYHITYVTNPYAYYKQLVDYFILFSLEDPCPYVILENILLSTNIICWEKNIFYDHKHQLINDIYIEIPGYISYESAYNAIKANVLEKKIAKSINLETNSVKYINQFFSEPTQIIKSINDLL